MKKMNVLFSMLTSAVMVLTPVSAFAEEDGGIQETTETVQETTEYVNGFAGGINTVEISVSKKSGYTITIPTGTDELRDGRAFTVAVNATLAYGKAMVVTVESAHDWKLVDNENSKNHVSYNMKVGETVLGEGGNAILEARYDAAGHSSSVKLVASDVTEPQIAGTYSDQLTFTIEERNVNEIPIVGAGTSDNTPTENGTE